VQHWRGRFARPDRLRDALVPEISRRQDWQAALMRAAPSSRFYAGVEAPDQTRAAFEQRFTGERDEARRLAGETACGELAFFGREFSFGRAIDWHADPVTGAAWPRVFHADVPVHGGNVGFGDVKDVWELNRHQFFIDLAKVAFLDQSAGHAAALHQLHAHWMADVPPLTGAAWANALEPAFRVWSWLWAYHMVRAADLVSQDENTTWLTGFHDHGRFLHRHLERYASPYNHLVGEASALFALGVLFPEFRAAAAWVARGREVLETTLASQFHEDGGGVEQSTFYHHASLGFYLLSAVLARRNGVELAPAAWAAIERGIAFSAALVQPDGRVPRIGGADDGKPIRLEVLPLWNFRPYQAIGAVLFGRDDFGFVAGRFWEDALWVLGPEGLEAFDRLSPREPATAAALPASGYYVVRSDWSADADYLCFDCGVQAAGLRRDDVPSAAHGHADCLSVVVSLGGREVLVDPGFFCYNGDPQWEVHFRRTAAHNTVVVDGADQAQHVSKMAWARTYEPRAEGWAPEKLGWVTGSHDGYAARAAGGIVHRRTAWLRTDGYAVLRDELTGTGGGSAEAVFQFAPGRLGIEDSAALFDERYELAWTCSAPVQATFACGGDGPADGWIAASLGVRLMAPRVTLRFALQEMPVVLLTVLADRSRYEGRRRVHSEPRVAGRPIGARVEGLGFSDEVRAAVTGSATTDDLRTDATLAIVRRSHGRVVDVEHAGGTYATLAGTVVQ
jgi:hypothetical protein